MPNDISPDLHNTTTVRFLPPIFHDWYTLKPGALWRDSELMHRFAQFWSKQPEDSVGCYVPWYIETGPYIEVTRMQVVRDALLDMAPPQVLEELGYTSANQSLYANAAKRMLPLGSVVCIKPVGDGTLSVAQDYASEVGGFYGEVCPEMVEGYMYDPGVLWVSLGGLCAEYEDVSLTFPWWVFDYHGAASPKQPMNMDNARRAARRDRAKRNLKYKIQHWNTQHNARPYHRNTPLHERLKHRHPSRHMKGAAFQWMRTQKDWPKGAVMNAIGNIYDLANITNMMLRLCGPDYPAISYGVGWFSWAWDYKLTVEERAKQDHSTPASTRLYNNQTSPPWESEAWCGPLQFLHAPTPSKSDPMLLAYFQTYDKFKRGIRTTIKPGRYLKKYYGIEGGAFAKVLTDEAIQHWAQEWERAFKPVPVHFKENTDPDGWEWVFSNERGFDSCMSAGHHSGRGPQAVRAYARPGNGLRLAYATYNNEPDGEVTARAIVNWDKKKRARVYGDARLGGALDALDVVSERHALEGAMINAIEYDEAHFYLPYIDAGCASGGGCMDVEMASTDDGSLAMIIGSGGVSANRYETALVPKYMLGLNARRPDNDYDDDDDVEEYSICDSCSNTTHPDDMNWSGHHGIFICDDCVGDTYVMAWTSTRYERAAPDYVAVDEVVEYGGDFYLNSSHVLEVNNLRECEYSDEIGHVDDMVVVPGGGWVLSECARTLDIPHTDTYGEEYRCAVGSDTTMLDNGLVIYDDDVYLDDVTSDNYHVDTLYTIKTDNPSSVLVAHSTLTNTALWAGDYSVIRESDGRERVVLGRVAGMPTLAERASWGVPFDNVTGFYVTEPNIEDYSVIEVDHKPAPMLNYLFQLTPVCVVEVDADIGSYAYAA